MSARYDEIGRGYARRRREDPAIAARIQAALGDARTVVNVGAGSGSYEPRDRVVVAIEPSAVMAAQRPPELPPAILASAGALPLVDDAVDAAMAVLTIHHWEHELEAGVRELRRVARGPVAILTALPENGERWWLMRDYLPEVAALDRRLVPVARAAGRVARRRGAGGDGRDRARLARLVASRARWAHPERVLDPAARAATSGFARMPEAVVARVVAAVERDLADGTWEARNGHLRELDSFDAGLRLVVAEPRRLSGRPRRGVPAAWISRARTAAPADGGSSAARAPR